jgi:hypothetical protein
MNGGEMSIKLLVLLGNENDKDGVLSETTINRINKAIELITENIDFLILPTGSFGDPFNISSIPHGKLIESFLLSKGIDKKRILPFTNSSTTIEDSYGVLRYLAKNKAINEVHILTSSFHMVRVKYIFSRVLQGYNLQYHEASNSLDTIILKKQIKHEERALKILRKEWVDISNLNLQKFPAPSYESIGNELRHYDNLSYLAIVGAFLLFGFVMNKKLPCPCINIIISIGEIALILLFLYLYWRLANTAAAARRVLKSIEKLYGVPGLSSTQNKTRLFGFNLTVKWLTTLIISIMIAYILINIFITIT